MMAGANRFALSGAKVEITEADGSRGPTFEQATVRYRDGVAAVKKGAAVVDVMDAVGDVVRISKRAYTITGTDGTVWTISKKGCCGSR